MPCETPRLATDATVAPWWRSASRLRLNSRFVGEHMPLAGAAGPSTTGSQSCASAAASIAFTSVGKTVSRSHACSSARRLFS